MANSLLENLSAASTLATTDLFPVKQAGARLLKATGTQMLALVGTAYVPLAGGTMTGALTIASGTLTASAPALNITQTWNNAGVNFSSVLVNVTNTASGSGSLLQDWQVASVSKAYIDRSGNINAVGMSATTVTVSGFLKTNVIDVGSAGDLYIYRDAAATLALRNGAAQQIFRVSNFHTDSSNYERLTLTGVAGTSVNITAETMGTGWDDLDVVITPAGTGRVRFGTHSAVGVEITTGYITIKDAGGTSRKIAVIS